MYGGPNRFFGEIGRILMEYASAHTNPTSMPQKKAILIIKAYQGGIVVSGILIRAPRPPKKKRRINRVSEESSQGNYSDHTREASLTQVYPRPPPN